jgi:Mycothiol maleylpyruvate isomerase N-terminal domain
MTSTTTFAILDESHQALRAVVAAIAGDGWGRPTPCREWNAAQVLRHAAGDQISYAAALDAAVHAWDLAAAAGLPSPLTAGLSGRLTPIARAIVEPLRDYGVYAAALTPVPGDDETAALLRYLGRAPEWTP